MNRFKYSFIGLGPFTWFPIVTWFPIGTSLISSFYLLKVILVTENVPKFNKRGFKVPSEQLFVGCESSLIIVLSVTSLFFGVGVS